MNLSKRVKAVVFDMDGVLIDSEIVYLNDLHKKLSKKRPWIKKEDLYPIVGGDDKRIKKVLCNVAGVSLDNKEFLSELEKIFQSSTVYFPDILRPEVPGLLKEIRRRGYRTALASSTKLLEIKKMLSQCNLEDFFEYVISGECFHKSKPNPEIYLHVAEQLELDPIQCLVVEDSTYGISAGIDAGMMVAALNDERFDFDQSRATYKIGKLSDLLAILDRIENDRDEVWTRNK